MPVNQPSYDTAVETSWDGVDQSEFESFEQFASVHVWWNTEDPETSEDVELPVAHLEDGELKLVYEALNSAYDLASNAIDSEENVEQVRNLLENLREEEFPDREPLDADQEESRQINTMNPEEKEERIQDINENQEQLKTADLQITGKDVEVVEKESQDSDGEIVVNVPIQALSEDRDGDFINEKGQKAIIRQLKSGTVPLMLNHGIGSNAAMYDARDIVGQFVDGDNQNGTTIGTARMRKSKDGESLHKDAKEIVDLLEQDMPIGFSVGFIPNPEETEERENGGMEISDLDLMEVSAVGIPSNPDAVPQAMGTAVQMAKNAGMQKDEIMNSIKKGFKDTMSENDKQDDSTENNEGKSEEQKEESKQLSEEVANEILSAANQAAESMLQDLEESLNEMVDSDEDSEENQPEDDDTEDEAEDEDEDEQESVESSSEPEEQAGSDHSEDKDEKSESSESADDKSGQEESGLSDEEKTVDDKDSDGRKMNTMDDEDQETSEEKSEVSYDPRMTV